MIFSVYRPFKQRIMEQIIKKSQIKCPNCGKNINIIENIDIDDNGAEVLKTKTIKCENCAYEE